MKTAFITGANRGLGYAFVEYFLDQGFLVFAGTRKIDESLPKRENLVWLQCDVLDDISIENVTIKIKEKTDHVDFLINNAGTNKDTIPEGDKNLVSKLGYLDRDALLNMFNINSVSPIIIIQKFIPLLTTRHSFVINISSARVSFDSKNAGSTANYGYVSSKIALNMLTFCSRNELPNNVKTFSFSLRGIRTDMNPDGKNEPIDQVKKIINITENWKDEYNGMFLDESGNVCN